MDKATADILLQVLAQPPGARIRLGKRLRDYVANYGTGTIRGQGATFSADDHARIRKHLDGQGYGHYVGQAVAGLDRVQALAILPNEKSGTINKTDRVCIKALPGHPLCLHDRSLHLPDECHLDADWHALSLGAEHRAFLVVENWTSFNFIHRLSLDETIADRRPVVVYRGDVDSGRADWTQACLAENPMPVLAFVDIDPAGLLIATQQPRLDAIVAPPEAILRAALLAPTGRRDRYQAQFAQAAPALDALPSRHPVAPLWALLKETRSAVMQERFDTDRMPCVCWSSKLDTRGPP